MLIFGFIFAKKIEMSQKYSVTPKVTIGATPPEKEKLEMGWGISLWGKMMAIPPPNDSQKKFWRAKKTALMFICLIIT